MRIFLLLLALFAQDQNSDLDRIVGSLQSKYNKLSTLSADFIQTYHAPGERPRRESGRLLLKKPGRMRWDYTTPETKLFISDGRYIYEYVPADGFASKSSVKETDDLRAPFMFLLGRGDLRREFKKIEFADESPVRAGNKVLRMIPKRAQDFRELLIEIDPQTLTLTRLSFIDSGNARSDFLFSNILENIPASDMKFKLPQGVEVRE